MTLSLPNVALLSFCYEKKMSHNHQRESLEQSPLFELGLSNLSSDF